MTSAAPWHPVLPAHAVRAGAPPVPARVQGRDLVAWRTAGGALQVWHARCPHRGVHLAFGRVSGDRLACAYHGWEFEAGSARCVAIPALADLAQVPGQVQAGTCIAREAQQMVWVQLQTGADAGAGAAADTPTRPADATPCFLRTLTLHAGLASVHAGLSALDFTPLAPAAWRGTLAGQALHLFTLEVDTGLSSIHAWCLTPPAASDAPALFAALRRLRSGIEPLAVPG